MMPPTLRPRSAVLSSCGTYRYALTRYLTPSPPTAGRFAYRATDVRRLALASDPAGPENTAMLQRLLDQATMIVPCWGSRAKLPPWLRPQIAVVSHQIAASGTPAWTLGLTRSGDPRHPLMLPYTTDLLPYTA